MGSPKCVSDHSDQLRFFDPRPPPLTTVTENEMTPDLV